MYDLWIHLTISTEARNRDGVIQEKFMKDPVSNGMSTHDFHGRPTRFLRKLYQQTHCPFGLEWTETGRNESKLVRFCDATNGK